MGGRSLSRRGAGLVKAHAVHFVAPRRVEVREVDLPAPAEGYVLVATEWSGISSGTELLAYRGEVDPELPLDETLGALAGTFAYPFRYGYSAVGRVVRPAGSLLEGQLVFAFHPHQDRFMVDAQGGCSGGRDGCPRGHHVPDGRDRPPGMPGCRFPPGGGGRGCRPGGGRDPGRRAVGPDRDGRPRLGTGAGAAGGRRHLRGAGAGTGRCRRRRVRNDRRAGSRSRGRGQREPPGPVFVPGAAGSRGDCGGLLLVRHHAGLAPSWRRVSPPTAGHPQHPGLHHPGLPSARGGTAAVAPRWPGGSHASFRSPFSAPTRSPSRRPPRPTPTRTGRRTA